MKVASFKAGTKISKKSDQQKACKKYCLRHSSQSVVNWRLQQQAQLFIRYF
jgi:hypothetical protein